MVLKQKPQLTRLRAIIEKNLGPIKKQIELLQAEQNGGRGNTPFLGIPQTLQQELKNLDSSNEGPRILALEREGVIGEARHEVAGDGDEGLDQCHVSQVNRREEHLQRRRPAPPQRREYSTGSHGDFLGFSEIRRIREGDSKVFDTPDGD